MQGVCLRCCILATAYRMRDSNVIQVTPPVKLVWMFRLGGFVVASTLRVQPWVTIELCIGAQCGKRWLRRSCCRVSGRCQVVSRSSPAVSAPPNRSNCPIVQFVLAERDRGTFVSGHPEASGRSAINSQVTRIAMRVGSVDRSPRVMTTSAVSSARSEPVRHAGEGSRPRDCRRPIGIPRTTRQRARPVLIVPESETSVADER
jgi:hypothetical protein